MGCGSYLGFSRLVLRHVAYIDHDAEVDGRGCKSLLGSVLSECVHEGVACGVGGLSSTPDDAGEGCEHDEEVELGSQKTVVEIPRSLYSGSHYRIPVIDTGFLEQNVLSALHLIFSFKRFVGQ